MSTFDEIFNENEKHTDDYYTGLALLENLYSLILKENPAMDLQEAVTYANSNLGTVYVDNGLCHHASLGITKRTWDRLAAKHIVGIQPMRGPIDMGYAFRYYADNDYGGSNNVELGYNKLDADYTLSDSTSASEMLGSNTTSDLGLGIGDGTGIKELSVKVEKWQVEAQTRKLRAKFSNEIFQDIKGQFHANLRQQLWGGIVKEIASEIDMEIINTIESMATTGSINFGSIAGDNNLDQFGSFISYITHLSNDIATTTNHGAGNFVIANPNICGILEAATQFSVSPMINDSKIQVVGYINNIKVLRNIFWDDDKFIVGFKGESALDAGMFYHPYILAFLQSEFSNSFQQNVGVITRYGISENIFGAENYYRAITVSDAPDFK